MSGIYDLEVTTATGETQSLRRYEGKVLLVVNVASKCGFTPQYAGLEALYRRHGERGLVVLGFPCNQFANQEPDTEERILTFCSSTYDVTFPIFRKLEVNGPNTHPLYLYLKSRCRGILGTQAVKWNFTKFLIDRHGNVLKRYAPSVKPDSLDKDIQDAMAGAGS